MKLTIIGGGSVRTPRLIPSLVTRSAALHLEEVWLMDTDRDKLDLIGSLCQSLAGSLGATFRLVTTTDAREAVQDSTAIITSIRPGKEQGRATDERIAMHHGVLGQETTGAAGFAMAMRSLPAILDYAHMVEAIAAPGAWLYNFTNPAGLVAQGLTYAGIQRVVGICDSANGAQHAVSRYLRVPLKRVRHSVYGLNHLSWTRSVRLDPDADGEGGEEVLPALLSDHSFIQSTHMAMFDPGLIAWQKAFLNEYLHYFYHRDQALAALVASWRHAAKRPCV
jgi:6-phospho-beta-glucosidase